MSDIITLLIRLLFLGSFIGVLVYVPLKIWKAPQWKNISNNFAKIIAKIATIFSVVVVLALVYIFILASLWTFEQANNICFGFSCPVGLK